MKKSVKYWIVGLLLLIVPVFLELVEFIFKNGFHKLLHYNFWNYCAKFFNILSKNIGFIGTILSIIVTFTIFDENQRKEREKILEESRKIENEKRELQEKEFEQYHDIYRPIFIENKNNQLCVYLKKKEILITDLILCDRGEIKKIGSKFNDEIIQLKNKENYFITGKTILGEQFLFGKIINGITVYKVLKPNANPKIPFTYEGDIFLENMIKNWKDYNYVENVVNNHTSTLEFQKIFFHNSEKLRNEIDSNFTSIFDILVSSDYKSFLENVLEYLTGQYDLNKTKVRNVVKTIDKILFENMSVYEIKFNIEENKEYFIGKLGDFYNNFVKLPPNYWGINTLLNEQGITIRNRLKVLQVILQSMKYEKCIDKKLTDYKSQFLDSLKD